MLFSLLAAAHAATLFTINVDTDELVAFDTITNTLSPVGPLGLDVDQAGLAWADDLGLLFMAHAGSPELFAVDPQTGLTVPLGVTHGILNASSVAWNPRNESVFVGGTGTRDLFEFNLGQLRSATYQGLVDRPVAMAWSPATQSLLTLRPGTFHAVDPFVVQTDVLASTPLGSLRGLTYNTEDGLYYGVGARGRFYALDPATGMSHQVLLDAPADHDGLTARQDLTWTEWEATVVAVCGSVGVIGVGNATPNAPVAVLLGEPDTAQMPGGPCAGTPLGLRNARVMAVVQTDAFGSIAQIDTLPQGVCGRTLQLVDMTTCTTSTLFPL